MSFFSAGSCLCCIEVSVGALTYYAAPYACMHDRSMTRYVDA